MTVEYIRKTAEGLTGASKGSHDWGHTMRVHSLCMTIGKTEGADLEVLSMAAYLHDIGRSYQDQSKGGICHAEKGAEIAEEILKKTDLPESKKENIIHCVRAHRFRGINRPETLEARVLFDADKIDSIGAIGIGRAFLFAGEVGATLHNPDVDPENSESYTSNDTCYREYTVKLKKIKDRILTQEGRRIAEKRHEFMEYFFRRFMAEYEGKE